MTVQKRISGFVAGCLLLAAIAPVVPGAHVVPDAVRGTLVSAWHAVGSGAASASAARTPHSPKGPHPRISVAPSGLDKAGAAFTAVAGVPIGALILAALALLGACAAPWLLGFISRSSRTRGQPRAVAL